MAKIGTAPAALPLQRGPWMDHILFVLALMYMNLPVYSTFLLGLPVYLVFIHNLLAELAHFLNICRVDWQPEATSGRRALVVFWRCPVVLWGPSTPNPTQVSWETLVLKTGRFLLCQVDMWWIGTMWPKCAFGDQKGLIQKKTC